MRRLSDLENTTILIATHALDEAEKVADRIIVLDQGRIVADGTVEQLARAFAAVAEVRWTSGGRRHVRAVRGADPTDFVRALLAQDQDVSELEVRRASLEDTYMALVQRAESGRSHGPAPPDVERQSDLEQHPDPETLQPDTRQQEIARDASEAQT